VKSRECLSHRTSAEILSEIPHGRFVFLPGQRHHYFVSDPIAVHKQVQPALHVEVFSWHYAANGSAT
jgi:hypothetical protein